MMKREKLLRVRAEHGLKMPRPQTNPEFWLKSCSERSSVAQFQALYVIDFRTEQEFWRANAVR